MPIVFNFIIYVLSYFGKKLASGGGGFFILYMWLQGAAGSVSQG